MEIRSNLPLSKVISLSFFKDTHTPSLLQGELDSNSSALPGLEKLQVPCSTSFTRKSARFSPDPKGRAVVSESEKESSVVTKCFIMYGQYAMAKGALFKDDF
jgi:hypothetical protein